MDDQDYNALTNKISELTLQNKQLRRANSNMKSHLRELRRVIRNLKEEISRNRKPHYRNGKRGTFKNG